jgi:acid phosphatase (class B)
MSYTRWSRRGWLASVLVQLVFAAIPSGCRGAHEHVGSAVPIQRGSVVSVDEYLRVLPAAPIAVGFDVDDTAVFSTPAFLYAKGRIVPDYPATLPTADETARTWRDWAAALDAQRDALFTLLINGKPGTLNPSQHEKWVRFWDDVNTVGDAFSPPKAIARRLVSEHLRRGDHVTFITARPNAGHESLTKKLRIDFGSDALSVKFTAQKPKDAVIREAGLKIYYGDADGDIKDAIIGGAEGVRIVRSRYSSNGSPTQPGAVGEWFVIAESDL